LWLISFPGAKPSAQEAIRKTAYDATTPDRMMLLRFN
jgi:hypothetical protein